MEREGKAPEGLSASEAGKEIAEHAKHSGVHAHHG
jgi:hypothetical protein